MRQMGVVVPKRVIILHWRFLAIEFTTSNNHPRGEIPSLISLAHEFDLMYHGVEIEILGVPGV